MDNANNWRDALTPPEEEGSYLVYMCGVIGLWVIAVAVYRPNEREWKVSSSSVITHWMPLPKRPGEL